MESKRTEAGFYAMDIEANEVPFVWTEDAIREAGADPIANRPALIDKLEAMQTIRGPTGQARRPTGDALGMLGVPVGHEDVPLAAQVGPMIDDVIVFIRGRQPEYVLLSREPCSGPQRDRLARVLESRRSAEMKPR